jgi:hypothetical protein
MGNNWRALSDGPDRVTNVGAVMQLRNYSASRLNVMKFAPVYSILDTILLIQEKGKNGNFAPSLSKYHAM